MMRNFLLLFCIAFLFGCASASKNVDFPLGVWYEGGVGPARGDLISPDPTEAAKMYDRDFADIAAHGIDTVVVPNTPPNHHKVLLDAAAKHGLKLIIELGFEGEPVGPMIRGNTPMDDAIIAKAFDERLRPIQNHPNLRAVQLLDEPAPDAFGRYAHIADALRAYDPTKPPFCCLAGTGGIESFAKMTKSNVVAWDHYPLGVKTPESVETMRAFADTIRNASLAAAKGNAEPWAVLQCHAITGGLRFPSPAEVRCMTNISLATGNKAIFWFLYQSEWLNKEKTVEMSGLVDRNFKSSDRWEEVALLVKQIKKMAPTLAKLHLTDAPPRYDGSCVTYTLTDKDGKVYDFTVNLDTKSPQKGLEPGGGMLHRGTGF